METAELNDRRHLILGVLEREIERQARTDLEQIDLVQLAVAIDEALDERAGLPERDEIEDGKEPDELNAANDG